MHAVLRMVIDKQPRAVKIGYCLTRDYSLHGTCSCNPDNPTPPPRSKPVPTLVCSAIEHPGAPRHWGTGAPTRWLVSFIGFQRAATPRTVTFPSPSFVSSVTTWREKKSSLENHLVTKRARLFMSLVSNDHARTLPPVRRSGYRWRSRNWLTRFQSYFFHVWGKVWRILCAKPCYSPDRHNWRYSTRSKWS